MPMQKTGMTVDEVRKSHFELLVALDLEGKAEGDVFVDDGDEMDMGVEGGKWTIARFECETDGGGLRFRSEVVQGRYAVEERMVVEKLVILGYKAGMMKRTRRGKADIYVDGRRVGEKARVRFEGGVTEVTGLELLLGEAFELRLKIEEGPNKPNERETERE